MNRTRTSRFTPSSTRSFSALPPDLISAEEDRRGPRGDVTGPSSAASPSPAGWTWHRLWEPALCSVGLVPGSSVGSSPSSSQATEVDPSRMQNDHLLPSRPGARQGGRHATGALAAGHSQPVSGLHLCGLGTGGSLAWGCPGRGGALRPVPRGIWGTWHRSVGAGTQAQWGFHCLPALTPPGQERPLINSTWTRSEENDTKRGHRPHGDGSFSPLHWRSKMRRHFI